MTCEDDASPFFYVCAQYDQTFVAEKRTCPVDKVCYQTDDCFVDCISRYGNGERLIKCRVTELLIHLKMIFLM